MLAALGSLRTSALCPVSYNISIWDLNHVFFFLLVHYQAFMVRTMDKYNCHSWLSTELKIQLYDSMYGSRKVG